MTIRNELVALRDSDGLIRAEVALEWAEANPRSALHKALEWDNEAAAYEHRLTQVRRLIVLNIRDEGGRPAVVSLSIDRVQGGGYRLFEDIQHVETMRAVLLADALKELERLRQKYQFLTELVEVWRAADAAAAAAARGRRGRGRPPGRGRRAA